MAFDYNTSRSKLVLPEYGRNIHMMVEYIKTIEDRDERNRLAHAVVAVMGNLNPHLRDINDFKHKLWDHLALIAKFDIDIDYPYDPPKPETFIEKPKKVEYGTSRIRFRHYGRAVEMLAKSAIELPDGEEKDKVINLIANHMKKAYITWNRENVDNDVVLSDLNKMVGGKIDISKIVLTETKDIISKNNPNNARRKRNFKKK